MSKMTCVTGSSLAKAMLAQWLAKDTRAVCRKLDYGAALMWCAEAHKVGLRMLLGFACCTGVLLPL